MIPVIRLGFCEIVCSQPKSGKNIWNVEVDLSSTSKLQSLAVPCKGTVQLATLVEAYMPRHICV